jgi:hypothetical protein
VYVPSSSGSEVEQGESRLGQGARNAIHPSAMAVRGQSTSERRNPANASSVLRNVIWGKEVRRCDQCDPYSSDTELPTKYGVFSDRPKKSTMNQGDEHQE